MIYVAPPRPHVYLPFTFWYTHYTTVCRCILFVCYVTFWSDSWTRYARSRYDLYTTFPLPFLRSTICSGDFTGDLPRSFVPGAVTTYVPRSTVPTFYRSRVPLGGVTVRYSIPYVTFGPDTFIYTVPISLDVPPCYLTTHTPHWYHVTTLLRYVVTFTILMPFRYRLPVVRGYIATTPPHTHYTPRLRSTRLLSRLPRTIHTTPHVAVIYGYIFVLLRFLPAVVRLRLHTFRYVLHCVTICSCVYLRLPTCSFPVTFDSLFRVYLRTTRGCHRCYRILLPHVLVTHFTFALRLPLLAHVPTVYALLLRLRFTSRSRCYSDSFWSGYYTTAFLLRLRSTIPRLRYVCWCVCSHTHHSSPPPPLPTATLRVLCIFCSFRVYRTYAFTYDTVYFALLSFAPLLLRLILRYRSDLFGPRSGYVVTWDVDSATCHFTFVYVYSRSHSPHCGSHITVPCISLTYDSRLITFATFVHIY